MIKNSFSLRTDKPESIIEFIQNYFSQMIPHFFVIDHFYDKELSEQMDDILEGAQTEIASQVDFSGYYSSIYFYYEYNADDFFCRISNDFFSELAKFLSEKFSIGVIFHMHEPLHEEPAMVFENGEIIKDFRSILKRRLVPPAS